MQPAFLADRAIAEGKIVAFLTDYPAPTVPINVLVKPGPAPVPIRAVLDALAQ